jgi:hypothetical protein
MLLEFRLRVERSTRAQLLNAFAFLQIRNLHLRTATPGIRRSKVVDDLVGGKGTNAGGGAMTRLHNEVERRISRVNSFFRY